MPPALPLKQEGKHSGEGEKKNLSFIGFRLFCVCRVFARGRNPTWPVHCSVRTPAEVYNRFSLVINFLLAHNQQRREIREI